MKRKKQIPYIGGSHTEQLIASLPNNRSPVFIKLQLVQFLVKLSDARQNVSHITLMTYFKEAIILLVDLSFHLSSIVRLSYSPTI